MKKKYETWKKENEQLPNLQTSEDIINRYKQQLASQQARKNSLDGRISTIEQKLDKLMRHLGVK